MIEIKSGQIYRWGEMREDEFGVRNFDTRFILIESLIGDVVVYKKGSHIENMDSIVSTSVYNLEHEIKAGRLHLIKKASPAIIKKSRLEDIDCD